MRHEFCRAVVTSLLIACWPLTALAWENLLGDPGFERYRLDESRGVYVPAQNAVWQEFAMGRGSVTFDAGSWKAPEDMLAEQALGFSPGADGASFEGMGSDQKSGRIIFQQDVVNPEALKQGGDYEAWVWIGGARNDDETQTDRKDEIGGWEVYFYGDPNPANWQESNALECHTATLDYHGEAESFVRVSGFGYMPVGTKGVRMRVWASAWASAAGGGKYDTKVAIDNAHFAPMRSSNLLVNGNFELDEKPGDLVGWLRPAFWPFPDQGYDPIDINDVYGPGFDHGKHRPYFGYRWAYGYATYLSGWVDDTLTMTQYVDYEARKGTPLSLMFYWLQNTAQADRTAQLRENVSEVQLVVQYFNEATELGLEQFDVKWPVASNPKNRCRYDQNAAVAYNPRFRLLPPDGTTRVGLHVSFHIRMSYREGWSHVATAVDEFYLGFEEDPKRR
jgi:hypothetical protein